MRKIDILLRAILVFFVVLNMNDLTFSKSSLSKDQTKNITENYNKLKEHCAAAKKQFMIAGINKNMNKLLSKPEAVKYRPQQVVVDDLTRYSHSYDSKGNELINLIQVKVNNEWKDSLKTTTEFNNNYLNETSIMQEFSNNSWANVYRFKAEYDGSGNMISEQYDNWSDTAWFPFFSAILTYNSKGQMTVSTNTYYLTVFLYQGVRETFTYDDNGNVLSDLSEVFNGNVWSNNELTTNVYNTSGMLQTKIVADWVNNAWVNSSRKTCTYSSNGNLLVDSNEIWRTTLWSPTNKIEYTYNEANLVTMFLYSNWRDSTWIPFSRSSYTFDNNMNRTFFLYENFNDSTGKNTYRMTYTYNNNNLVTVLKETYANKMWGNLYINRCTYDINGNTTYCEYNEWKNNSWQAASGNLMLSYDNGAVTDYYDGHTITSTYTSITGVNESPTVVLNYTLNLNYPNPFNPSTVISYTLPKTSFVTLKVYDITGREISTLISKAQNAGRYAVEFNGNNIASGVYFYRLSADDFTQVRKMILMK